VLKEMSMPAGPFGDRAGVPVDRLLVEGVERLGFGEGVAAIGSDQVDDGVERRTLATGEEHAAPSRANARATGAADRATGAVDHCVPVLEGRAHRRWSECGRSRCRPRTPPGGSARSSRTGTQ